MDSKTNTGPARVERGSAHFHTIDTFTFWMNPTNRIFIRTGDGRVIWPRTQGGQVHYDDPHFVAPPEVAEWLLTTLKKQQALRNEHFVEEHEDAFTFH